MAAPYQARIAGLADAELLQYLRAFQGFRTEAVMAALVELDRRGLAFPEAEKAEIQRGLEARDAAALARLDRSFVTGLGPTTAARLRRIRQLTAGLLAVGLGSALAIYLRTAPKGPNPLGYEPEDTKQYLRDLELYGGKVNVLATEFMNWWDGLWQGRNLASTVAWLTVLAALAFWYTASRRARHLERLEAGSGR
jgi:hypothetical protein